jgi:chromosomal replication initiation ATPase DnaA
VLKAVKTRLNKDVFNTWFKPIKFVAIDADQQTLTLRAGQVTKDWISMYYTELLTQTLAELDLSNYQIDWGDRSGPAGRAAVRRKGKRAGLLADAIV